MSEILKGNFEVRKPVKAAPQSDDLDSQFEREALKRLGGSIAFVSKKKFLYGAEPDNAPEKG
jgi:hypothetical protein